MKTNTRLVLFNWQLPFVAAALFAAALCVSTANAGPQPMESKSMAVAPQPFTWTGFYLGFNLGALITDVDIGAPNRDRDMLSLNAATLDSNSSSDKIITEVDLNAQLMQADPNFVGVDMEPASAFFFSPGHSSSEVQPIGGVDLGYNWQVFNHLVFGFGFGFSFTHTATQSNFEGSDVNFFESEFPQQNLSPQGRFFEVEADTEFKQYRRVTQIWSGYVGPQIGWAFDRWLVYVTGGFAFGEIDLQALDRARTDFFGFEDGGGAQPSQKGDFIGTTDTRLLTKTNGVQEGWYAGGGVKWALKDTLSMGLEFRHVDLGSNDYTLKSLGTPIIPGTTRVDVENNQVLLTVTILLSHLGGR